MKINVNTNPTKPYIIFDIDGTLANIKHRLQHIQERQDVTMVKKKNPDWPAFNKACSKDEPNQHVVEIYRRMCAEKGRDNNPAIFVTGRAENYREQTEAWLREWSLIPHYLFMRPYDDFNRSDVEIKREIVEKYIKDAPILFVIDDRDKVVNMWRELGYKCLQCQKGDY